MHSPGSTNSVVHSWRWACRITVGSAQDNRNFLGKRHICAVLSAVMIASGMIAFFARGQKNYDIDFTGGTMVTFQLTEDAATDEVQSTLASQFTDAFTLERLSVEGDAVEGIGKHFRLRTTESDSAETQDSELSAEERVRDKVYQAFKDNSDLHLRMVTMEFSEISPISVAADDESAEALQLKRFDGGS